MMNDFFAFVLWKRSLGTVVFGILLAQTVFAKNLFLVSTILGEGVVVRGADGPVAVKQATYLPRGERISVRPRSGLETLAAGRTLRFGAETMFTVEEERLVVHEGSLLYRTRKMESFLLVKGPEAEMSLDGMGVLMLEVEPNGGFKLVGLLGRIRVTDKEANRATQLLPGELLFVKPGGRGFGDKVSVNLEKIGKTSFLVAGFENLSSFERSLSSVAKAQGESIAKHYRAEVGAARGVDTFEVVPIASVPEEKSKPEPAPVAIPISPRASDPSPLEELLGRPPKRLYTQPSPPIKPNTGPVQASPPPPPVSAVTSPPDNTPPTRRIVSENANRIVFEDEKGQLRTKLIFKDSKEPAVPTQTSPSPLPVPSVTPPEPAVTSPAPRNRLPGRLFDRP